MKAVCTMLFVLFLAMEAAGQNFPADFVGNWKGIMEEYRPGEKMEKKPVQVWIQPTDTLNQYTWLLYTTKDDSLSFILKPIDLAEGEWVLSLRGMLFHQYWLGNKLQGAYTSDLKTVYTTYFIKDGQLIIEFSSTVRKPLDV